jgi:Putative Actinobacterial Holin-X, holin superfamily III
VSPFAGHENPIEKVREAVAHSVRLAQLELELKRLELRGRAFDLGIAATLGVAAVLLAPLLVAFLFAAAAAALATVMHAWLAILIVSGILFLIVAGLAAGAIAFTQAGLKRGRAVDG